MTPGTLDLFEAPPAQQHGLVFLNSSPSFLAHSVTLTFLPLLPSFAADSAKSPPSLKTPCAHLCSGGGTELRVTAD